MAMVREGYKETEIGVIPVDWEVIELSNISDLITKGTTPTTYGFDFVNEGVNFIKIESINDAYGTLIPESFSKITNQCHQKLSRSILESEDILFAIAGATVGKCAMIKSEEIPANTNQALAIIRIKENENKQFVFHQLRGYYIQQKIKQIKTNTAQPNLNLKQIGDFKFAYPESANEQQRIADILSTTDAHIENLDKIIADYNLLKKGMMKKLLTEGIGHTEFKETEIGRIPKEWDILSINDVADSIIGGGTPSRNNSEFYIGDIPWITVKDLDGNFFKCDALEYINMSAIENSATNLIEANSVIIATRMGLGRGFINTKPLAINQDMKALKMNSKVNNTYFLYWYLSNATGIESLGSGTTVKGIRIEALKALKLPIPSKNEQNQIYDVLSSLDLRIDLFQKERHNFIQLKKSLTEKLLTGKLRVQ